MKRPLITAALLLCGFAQAAPDTFTATVKDSDNATMGTLHASGFTFDFNASAEYQLNGEEPPYASYTSYTLKSVTLDTNRTIPSNIKLAVYEYDDASNVFVSYVGSSQVGTASKNYTNFTLNVTDFDISKSYAFCFVDADASDADCQYAGSTIDLGMAGVAKSANINAYDIEDNLVLASYNQWYKTANAMYTIEGVPEPTTATLSLLALAGLAARRRRK